MASLTISLNPEVLRALAQSRSIKIAVGSNDRAASRAGHEQRRGGSRGARAARRGKVAGPRAGSLPAKLAAWAEGRKRPFGVADIMKAMKVKRSHASMLLTGAVRRRLLRREGRGEYVGRS